MRIAMILATLLLTSAAAHAACPPALSGTDAEVLQHNRDRLVCLNRELAERSDQIGVGIELNQLDNSIRRLEIQRRFDNLPKAGDF